MKANELLEAVGRITKQNQTVDVGPDEVTKQAAKFGNKVDKDGRPPTLSKRVKGKSTNVLFNLGLASETYTRDQLPQIKNSQLKNIKHTLETVAINTIIPVQEERIIENFKRQVDKIVAGNYKPIIVDCDNKIVNGHHRYTALQMLEYKEVQIARLPWTLEQILDEGQAINNPKNTFLTKSDTAYDFLRVGKTISNLSNAKKSDNRDEPDVMVVPFGGKKEKDHLKKGLKKAGYKTQDADKPGDDAHVDENFAEQKAHDAIFQEILVDLLQEKYPDAEFDYQGDKVISADGKLTVIADLQVEDGYGGVWVWDVDTGPYKGVLGTAIKQATAELLRQQPDIKPALFVDGDNQNPGAWQAIANKLNYTLLDENFADGKVKGKSRPGRVKKSGASCNGSVTALRKRAKNASGERAKMYHWCANMKSGKKKK